MSIEAILARVIAREGKYVFHPDDAGGPTNWGITEAVARRNGYTGPMEIMPRSEAERIYFYEFYVQPHFHLVLAIDDAIAEKLVDTGVNMGPGMAVIFLQRALNALNVKGELYPDVPVDGRIGPQTLSALKSFLAKRGLEGKGVLLRALNCLQGARYIELAEKRQANEAFVYGWLKQRVEGLNGGR